MAAAALGIDGRLCRHGVVAERPSERGVRGLSGAQRWCKQRWQHGGAIMAKAASRLACWVCWLRHDGLLDSALGKQEAEQGREKERREREPGLTAIFLKILCGGLKNFQYKSCREFKSLQLLFQEKVYSSNGLKVILNFRKL